MKALFQSVLNIVSKMTLYALITYPANCLGMPVRWMSAFWVKNGLPKTWITIAGKNPNNTLNRVRFNLTIQKDTAARSAV